MTRRNFKIDALVPLLSTNVRAELYGPPPIPRFPGQIKTDGLHAVARAFVRNADRLDSMALGVPLFVFMGKQIGEHGTAPYAGPGQSMHFTSMKTGERVVGVNARGWESVDKWLKARPEIEAGIKKAAVTVNHYADLEDDSVDAILTSLVTSCWSTFEILASDLWESALNCHPRKLASLSGKTKRQEESERRKNAGKQKKTKLPHTEKLIPLGTIASEQFDILGKMGTILKDKLKARGLNEIADGYRLAFSKDSDRIMAALEGDSLRRLSAVRNRLVHHAGIADEKFCKKWNVPQAESWGTKVIGLDGEIVRGLVDPVVGLSLELIFAVDGWLQKY